MSDRAIAALALGLVVLCAIPASGQLRPDGSGTPDLNDLALEWTRGQFAAPLLCEVKGVPTRGLRRLLIAPDPRATRPRANRLRVFDLELEDASRCFDELGAEEFNLVGALSLTLPGRSRPDSARRDFAAALRRENGFDFRIREGRLRVAPVGGAETQPRVVDFADGLARVRNVERGSDAARRLREFEGGRRLSLMLEAKDGTTLRFDMVQYATR